MKKLFFFLLAFSIISFWGCNTTDPDVEAPLIVSATLDGNPIEASVEAGNTLTFTGEFSDNIDLKEYKIDIHSAFDGHGHGKTDNSDLTYIQILPLSGTLDNDLHLIDIPNDASSGPYDCIIRVIDAEGNEGDLVELELEITQLEQPIITVYAPDFSAGFSINAGDTLATDIGISDANDIVEVDANIYALTAPGGDQTGTAIYSNEWSLPGTSDLYFDIDSYPIVIPAGTTAGAYTLNIKVIDSDGNHTIRKYEFTIL